MGKFGINYREIYEKYYEISGDDINTAEDAKNRLLEEIGEGKLYGPEECCESSYEITRLDTAILLISAFDGEIHTTGLMYTGGCYGIYVCKRSC